MTTRNAVRRSSGASVLLVQYLVLAIALAAALGPVMWTLVSSFKADHAIQADAFSLPAPPPLDGYRDASARVDLPLHLLNTLLFASVAALVCPTVALLAAYPCTRLRFPLRNALVLAFSAALAIPAVALIVPEFFLMLRTGLLDTKIGLILFYSTLFFPLAFVILRSFLLSLPKDVEEAAMIDGASYFRIVFAIAAPMLRPALTTIAVLVFVGVWNDFVWNLVLAPGFENRNAQVVLASFQGQFTSNVTALLAGVTIVLLVPVLIFLCTQRYAIAGLATGARSRATPADR